MTSKFKLHWRNVWEVWDKFWFQKEGVLNLAWMRIFLAGTMCYTYFWRTFNISYFQEGSMLPREYALKIYPEFTRPPFFWCFWPDSWALGVHVLFVGLLLLICLGIANRPLMLATWVLHIGFIQRNYSVLFGADVISCLLLFYLSWTQCCERLRFFSGIRITPRKETLDILSSVFYRMIQIQMVIIYAYTGFEKLKGATWWDGTALWTVLANPQMTAFDMTWLRHFGILILAGSFIAIIFEIYFPVMVFIPRMKLFWLGLGIIFHGIIGALMGLMTFSLVMLSTYFLFLDSQEISRWSARLRGH